MTARWSVTDYIAKLPEMPLAELCARLRGEYADASYGKHPLHAEAARRLEMLRDAITEVEWLRERDQEEVARRLEAMQAEIERLDGLVDAVRRQEAFQALPGRAGGMI